MYFLAILFASTSAFISYFHVNADPINSNLLELGDSQAAEDVNYHYNIRTFKVPVDHFSFSTNDTFSIRYLVNDTWQHEINPPIFFYTGNEGDIELFAQNTGFMWDIAPTFGALLIFAEHRYYGKSMPFGNESFTGPAHLGYLTSHQALADYADLICYLKSASNLKDSSVIVFGGSYGGMLSAWIRMKYPHLVEGAIASSAPILQFTDVTACDAFSRIVTSDFQAAHPECPKLIRKSWKAITNITSSEYGKQWLSQTWKLCEPLTNVSDIELLKAFLVDVYSNLAMVDYPYPSNFLAPLPAFPISAFCNHLKSPSHNDKSLLVALNKAVSVFTNSTGTTECLTISESSAPNLDARGWSYQACTEMVMPMCSNGVDDMFELSPWNFTKFSDDCYSQYETRPQPYLACEEYGCKDLSTTSNIIFSNGLLDPWSSGGVMSNVSLSTLAILIPGGAHHLDLRASNPQDPVSVILARKMQRRYIKKWIHEHRARIINNNSTRYKVINIP